MQTNDEFTQKAKEHLDTIYRVALNYTGSPADAEDVSQEVLLRLYRTETSFGSEDYLKNWLIRVTINESKRVMGGRWRKDLPIEDYAEKLVFNAEENGDVFRMVMNLPLKYRIALYLHYFEGYTAEEIAKLLRIPASTVRTRMERGRKQLKKTLEETVEMERYKQSMSEIHAPERILSGAIERAQKRELTTRKRRHWGVPAAVVAMLCIALVLGLLTPLDSSNAFTVKAYVMEQTEDGGLTLRETDLLDAQEYWGGHYDGETGNYFINIALKCEGDNLERVTFRTEDGFFAKQYFHNFETLDGVQRHYVGPDNRLVMVGTDFDVAGSELTLDESDDLDDLLLFWGGHADSQSDIPHQFEFTATALFRNGKTQQIPVSIDLNGKIGTMSFSPSEAERRERAREAEYFKTLPLEKCELIEDSVMPVTKVYDYKIDDSGLGHVHLTYFDALDSEFDDDGVFRIRMYGWTHIAVLRRDADGNMTGMVYRIPEELQYH